MKTKLRIPYADLKARNNAKYNGFRWNPLEKVWEHPTLEITEKYFLLFQYLVKDTETNPNADGCFGVGCITTAEKAARWGFDAIEH